MGANLVALEAVKWLAGYRGDSQQSIWTSAESTWQPVLTRFGGDRSVPSVATRT